MIIEIASILIKQGSETSFEAAVAQALPLFQRSNGCRAARLERSLDHACSYRLVVEWETLEDHIVHFRASPEFDQWRALAAPHFTTPPSVDHVEIVIEGFRA